MTQDILDSGVSLDIHGVGNILLNICVVCRSGICGGSRRGMDDQWICVEVLRRGKYGLQVVSS